MNDNLITFTGWVGSQIEVAEVLEGVHVASFRVGSTPRRLRDGRWEDGETVWYAVKAWRRLAENVGASLRIGDPVIVSGRLEAESWTAQDGSTVTRYVVRANAVGHDLARGRSAFVKPAVAAPASTPVSDDATWAVPSADDEVVGAQPDPVPSMDAPAVGDEVAVAGVETAA